MKKTIVAIGGGELGEYETLPIDKKIRDLSGKKFPHVLFIPTASGDAEGYCSIFDKVYGDKLKCKTDTLLLVREYSSKKEIKEKIAWADIVYVGGGDTLKMLRIWRKVGVDCMLSVAYRKGTLLTGVSAGAICWFRYGSSDARMFHKNNSSDSLMRIRGLDFYNITFSPHHIREKNIRDFGLKKMMKRTPGVALAVDDCAALVLNDDHYKVITSKKGAGIRKFYRRSDKVVTTLVEKEGSINHLMMKN